jgi:hypothetical protein
VECYAHLRAPAVGVCTVCGKAVCRKCARIYASSVVCSTDCERKLAATKKGAFFKQRDEPQKVEASANSKKDKPAPPPVPKKKVPPRNPAGRPMTVGFAGTLPAFSMLSAGFLVYGGYRLSHGDDIGLTFLLIGGLAAFAMILMVIQVKYFN